MDLKVYVGQTIVIGCVSNIDIDLAENTIKYTDPKGVTGTFTGEKEIVGTRKVRTKEVLTIPGTWKVWLVSRFSNGDELISTPYSIKVYREGT